MIVKDLINRKIVLMVLGPMARALMTLITGYLTAKGIPAEMVGQFSEAIMVASAVIFNIGWELVDRRQGEARAVFAALASLADGDGGKS